MTTTDLLLAAAFTLIAALYATVGHAGASGYIAAMTLFGVAPTTIRPVALALNVLVAGVGVWRFQRARLIDWSRLWPFVAGSVPAAYFAAKSLHSPQLIRPALAFVLACAAVALWWNARATTPAGAAARAPNPLVAALSGAVIGVLSGLTGTGGAIFLSPLLLLARWSETRAASGLATAFVLANSLAGLAGLSKSATAFPTAMPVWLGAVAIGALLGARLGTGSLPTAALRRVLAVVLVIAAAKLAFA